MKLRPVFATLLAFAFLIAFSAQAGHHEGAQGKSRKRVEGEVSDAVDEIKARGKRGAEKVREIESEVLGDDDEHDEKEHDHDDDADDDDDADHGDDDADHDDEDYEAKAKDKADEMKNKGQAKAAEMRERRDERKAIKDEYKAAAEPGTPRAGKKPWWKFWGSDE